MKIQQLFAIAIYLLLALCTLGIEGGCPRASIHRKRAVEVEAKGTKSNAALAAANNFTLLRYDTTRSDLLSLTQSHPLIIVNTDDDTMKLLVNGQIVHQIDRLAPEDYDNLKMISHTPFTALLLLDPTVYLATNPSTHYTIKPEDLMQAKEYLKLVEAVKESLDTCCRFEGKVLKRQHHIVDAVLSTLSKATSSGQACKEDIYKLGNVTVESINENIKDATIINLNYLNSVVMEWKKEMTMEQFDLLKVIVMSSHMPRHGQLHMQYFSRLLKTNITSGLRVVYAEHVQSVEEAMELFGTHLTDFTAGEAFWGYADHMHSDIQAEATKNYLPHIIPNVH